MFLEVINPMLFAGMLVAFFASGMTAYAGFGGALVMVPLFTLMIGPVQAIALTGLCSAVALFHLVPGQLRLVRWKEAAPLVAGLLVAISLSSGFLVKADPAFVRLCMGACVLLAACIRIRAARAGAELWGRHCDRRDHGRGRGAGRPGDGDLLPCRAGAAFCSAC